MRKSLERRGKVEEVLGKKRKRFIGLIILIMSIIFINRFSEAYSEKCLTHITLTL